MIFAGLSEVQLRVTAYGFYSTAMFARRLRPMLTFVAKLVRADDSVAWKHRRTVHQWNNETSPIFPEEIERDPTVGTEALRTAAQVGARKAVATLR